MAKQESVVAMFHIVNCYNAFLVLLSRFRSTATTLLQYHHNGVVAVL